MRKFPSIGSLVIVFAFGAFGTPAFAGGSDCGKGPPAGWYAPRVTYTYSGGSSDRGYARASQHSTVRYTSHSASNYRHRSERW